MSAQSAAPSAAQTDSFNCLSLESPSRFNLNAVHFYAASSDLDNRTQVGPPGVELAVQGKPTLTLAVDKHNGAIKAVRNDERLVEFVQVCCFYKCLDPEISARN